MKNRILSALLAVCFLLALLPSIAGAEGEVNIQSADDFLAFAKNCTLDTWSQGKTVHLLCDIDLTGTDFSPVPVFCGTFRGHGHSITGVTFAEDGSDVGLFRYIQPSGVVQDLSVEASITPGGTKCGVGGIAGKNMGTVQDCDFHGTVKGDAVVGGIAGKNGTGGHIQNCTVYGTVVGNNGTGGIVGKNEGTVQSCLNMAAVNTTYEEKKNDLSNINTDVDAVWETVQSDREEREEESVLGHTDTGGIAGNSTGIVQGCQNRADIGYPHIGYNVGGIVGRQSGYLLGCQNYGYVQGRKDVGGIVGQMEPYLILDASQDTLKNLRGHLNDLYSIANQLVGDTGALGDDANSHLDEISRYSKTARDSTEGMLRQGADFVDDNLEEINVHGAVLTQSLNKIEPAFTALENGADDLSKALDDMSDAFSAVQISGADGAVEELAEALRSLADSTRTMKRAANTGRRAMRELEKGISLEHPKESRQALSDLQTAIKSIDTSKQEIKTSIGNIRTVLETDRTDFEGLGMDVDAILAELTKIETNLESGITALGTVDTSLSTLIQNTTVDFSSVQDAADDMEWSLELLEKSMGGIVSSMDEIADAMGNMGDQLGEAQEKISSATDHLSYAVEDLSDATANIHEAVTDLSNEDPLSFTVLGDDFQQKNDDLFDALSGISDEMQRLRRSVSDRGDQISGDLTQLNDRFRMVMDLVLDELERLSGENSGISDLLTDVSDEDIQNTRQGKVAECENFGKVEADRNIGGIAGSLAIEYTIDPEDEIEKPTTFRFTYQTKAILEGCVNNGEVLGKKDCVGGVAGLSELGTVYECQNYGSTLSTDGNYVGGIIGRSEASVRRCYAKSNAEGKRYVGGVAGKGTRVSNSYAIPTVSGAEAVGAICGTASEDGAIAGNYFVDSGQGGIDSVSYHGKAEPISFDALKSIPSMPERMTGFTVTFVAEDRTIFIQDMNYGDPTARIKYPEVPDKDTEFGHWDEVTEETVTHDLVIGCSYQPYITSLASVEQDGKLSLALAEGKFTDRAVFHVTPSDRAPCEQAKLESKVYDLTLEGTDIGEGETVTVRVANPNKDDVRAWVWTENGWQETSVTARGKYAVITVNGPKATVCLEYTPRELHILLPILAALLVIGGIACGIWLHKKRKKKVSAEEKTDEASEKGSEEAEEEVPAEAEEETEADETEKTEE